VRGVTLSVGVRQAFQSPVMTSVSSGLRLVITLVRWAYMAGLWALYVSSFGAYTPRMCRPGLKRLRLDGYVQYVSMLLLFSLIYIYI
jgi:hypothetical protein